MYDYLLAVVCCNADLDQRLLPPGRLPDPVSLDIGPTACPWSRKALPSIRLPKASGRFQPTSPGYPDNWGESSLLECLISCRRRLTGAHPTSQSWISGQQGCPGPCGEAQPTYHVTKPILYRRTEPLETRPRDPAVT